MTEKVSNLMAGRRGLVMGVANERSIAWGIASKLHEHGAELAFTYQGEVLEKRVRPLAERVGSDKVFPCDVTDSASIDSLFDHLAKAWDGGFDFLVHAIAFADKDELRGAYLRTSRKNFLNALDISCYSLTAVLARAEGMLREGGSVVTLTYYGSEKAIPNYNVMGVAKAALEASVRYLASDLGPRGIRVNAISAGPIKTLASSGIGAMGLMLKWNAINAPLRRNVAQEDVGGAAVFLLSDLARSVTGEIMYVDGGYNTVGMLPLASVGEARKLLEEVEEK